MTYQQFAQLRVEQTAVMYLFEGTLCVSHELAFLTTVFPIGLVELGDGDAVDSVGEPKQP